MGNQLEQRIINIKKLIPNLEKEISTKDKQIKELKKQKNKSNQTLIVALQESLLTQLKTKLKNLNQRQEQLENQQKELAAAIASEKKGVQDGEAARAAVTAEDEEKGVPDGEAAGAAAAAGADVVAKINNVKTDNSEGHVSRMNTAIKVLQIVHQYTPFSENNAPRAPCIMELTTGSYFKALNNNEDTKIIKNAVIKKLLELKVIQETDDENNNIDQKQYNWKIDVYFTWLNSLNEIPELKKIESDTKELQKYLMSCVFNKDRASQLQNTEFKIQKDTTLHNNRELHLNVWARNGIYAVLLEGGPDKKFWAATQSNVLPQSHQSSNSRSNQLTEFAQLNEGMTIKGIAEPVRDISRVMLLDQLIKSGPGLKGYLTLNMGKMGIGNNTDYLEIHGAIYLLLSNSTEPNYYNTLKNMAKDERNPKLKYLAQIALSISVIERLARATKTNHPQKEAQIEKLKEEQKTLEETLGENAFKLLCKCSDERYFKTFEYFFKNIFETNDLESVIGLYNSLDQDLWSSLLNGLDDESTKQHAELVLMEVNEILLDANASNQKESLEIASYLLNLSTQAPLLCKNDLPGGLLETLVSKINQNTISDHLTRNIKDLALRIQWLKDHNETLNLSSQQITELAQGLTKPYNEYINSLTKISRIKMTWSNSALLIIATKQMNKYSSSDALNMIRSLFCLPSRSFRRNSKAFVFVAFGLVAAAVAVSICVNPVIPAIVGLSIAAKVGLGVGTVAASLWVVPALITAACRSCIPSCKSSNKTPQPGTATPLFEDHQPGGRGGQLSTNIINHDASQPEGRGGQLSTIFFDECWNGAEARAYTREGSFSP